MFEDSGREITAEAASGVDSCCHHTRLLIVHPNTFVNDVTMNDRLGTLPQLGPVGCM